MKIGDTIEFHAQRIIKGNPVKGILKEMDSEWIEVELAHKLEGMANEWYKGESKSFRLSLINGEIKVINAV